MKRIYILCEGQTEETFVNSLLQDFFVMKNIILQPIICQTKRDSSGVKHRGGVSTYGKIQKELLILLNDRSAFVTMMFDLYAFPNDTPGIDSIPSGSALDRACYIEEKIRQDIDSQNFLPNVVLYEFEGLLFASPEKFAYLGLNQDILSELQKIRDSHESPEHINDRRETAPSKRILKLHPGYSKVTDGVNIAQEIGLEMIMKECFHFRNWIKKMLAL